MKIVKIKLLNDGMKGLEYHTQLPVVKDNVTIMTFSKVIYPIPVPKDIRNLIQRMKKYMLDLTGYWQDEYDQYVSKGEIIATTDAGPEYYRLMKIMQNTRVEELSRFKGKYNIIGYYINKWKMPIKLNASGITVDIGYEAYEKLDTGMNHIFDTITAFIEDKHFQKMDAKQYAFDFWGDNEAMMQRIEGLNDEQLEELQAKHMEEKGYVIFKYDENTMEEEDNVSDVKAEVIEEEVVNFPGEEEVIDNQEKVEDI